jgi:integrase
MAEIKERKRGTWLVRVFLGRDPLTGRTQYHNHTIHGTKKDAESYARDAELRKEKGQNVSASTTRLTDYLDEWLKHKANGSLAPNTLEQYTEILGRYVKPLIGRVRLRDLNALVIQAAYDHMSSRVSARTVRYTHAVLSSALKQAVKWRMMPDNPALLVDLPKKQQVEMLAISGSQVKQFLGAAAESKHFTLFALMLETGLRPSEALGLKRQDVDFARGTLTVQRTLIWKRNGKDYYFGEPKTKKSRRSVPLSPQLIEYLRRHLAKQGAVRLKAGPAYKDEALLFAGENGQPLRVHNLIVRHFKPALKRAKLPEQIRLYDLRHSCATILLEQGEHPKVVAERLGHSSTGITLDVYSHVAPTMQKNASAKIANQMYGRRKSHSSHTKGESSGEDEN